MRVLAKALTPQMLLLMLLVSCTDKGSLPVPPPNELAPISAELRERVHANAAALKSGGLAKAKAALEQTLADIEREYGKKSIAVPQSLTETGLMIMQEANSYVDALPYMARALDASVAAYGPEHRETAFAVHDLAVQLLSKCFSQPPCAQDDPLLVEATQLSAHSRKVLGTDEARGNSVVAISTQAIDSPSAETGCGHANPADKVGELSWVRTDAKVYRLTPVGEFSVGGFDGRPWKQIGRHSFEDSMGSEILSSTDHRWIAYSGTIPGKRQNEIWLFDARTETERPVAIAPQYHLSRLEFSPDGATLAYFSNYDNRWTGKEGMGLYLVDTQTGENRFAGYPTDTKIGPLLGFGSIYWSADGRAVLLHLVGHPNDEFTREFHRFDLSSHTFRKIDGNFDKTYRHSEEFVDQGRTIEKVQNDFSKSNAWYRESKSPGGTWFAHVDDKHRLLISGAKRRERVVQLGGYNDCEGETIGITGWAEDKYLVYRHQSRQFIFDPVTGRRAPLFGAEGQNTYTW